MFVVQAIPDSNLVLVVTQADCDCSRQYGPILLEPKEIKYILQTSAPPAGLDSVQSHLSIIDLLLSLCTKDASNSH